MFLSTNYSRTYILTTFLKMMTEYNICFWYTALICNKSIWAFILSPNVLNNIIKYDKEIEPCLTQNK